MITSQSPHSRIGSADSSKEVHPTTVGKVENAERGMSLVTFSKISQVFVDHDCTYFVYDVIEEVATWG
jgi:hypothetical protein